MPIPQFEGAPVEYWLPPGQHDCTLEEARARFVTNDQRRKVWLYFEALLLRLRDLGARLDHIIVDGSFVTGRESPDDVDAFAQVDPADLRTWLTDPNHGPFLRFLLTEPQQARKLLGVHFFAVHLPSDVDDLIETFTVGIGGSGLRPPDPDRDPADLVVPAEKGILRIDLTDFFAGDNA